MVCNTKMSKNVDPSEERGRMVVHNMVSCLSSSVDEGDTYLEKVCGSTVCSGESEAAHHVSYSPASDPFRINLLQPWKDHQVQDLTEECKGGS